MSESATGKPGAVPIEERRHYVRIRKEVKLTCRVTAGPEILADISTRNLGAGGLLICTHAAIAVGTKLQFHAILESTGVQCTFDGRVVWSGSSAAGGRHEAGVALLGMDAALRHNILSLVGKTAEHEGIERRHLIRLKRRLVAEYRPARALLARWRTAHTQDLSVGGLALTTEESLDPGAALRLRVHLDEQGTQPLAVDGTVLESKVSKAQGWQTVSNVRFEKVTEEVRQRLAAYVSRLLSVGAGPAAPPEKPKD